jgi:hypothetical protein
VDDNDQAADDGERTWTTRRARSLLVCRMEFVSSSVTTRPTPKARWSYPHIERLSVTIALTWWMAFSDSTSSYVSCPGTAAVTLRVPEGCALRSSAISTSSFAGTPPRASGCGVYWSCTGQQPLKAAGGGPCSR